jgi:uncharacterized repeat protein (TIGR01451 family)
VAALLFSSPAPAQSPFDRCSDIGPGALPQIEVLPESGPLVLRADTCALSPTLESYAGRCGIAQVPYPGKDAIYEVRLHEGNRVGFRLRPVSGPGGPPDLMLALLSQCGAPDSCVVNSPDFIGPGSEELPPQRYDAGVYYLYVDSASLEADSCGAYTLTVEGTNPTPDLLLSLAGSPDPVVAGEHLTYRVVVSNEGTLEATEVEVVVDVPEETSLEGRDPRCELDGPRRVRCPIPSLPVGESELRLLRVRVAPSARGTLTARGVVSAKEGRPDHANALTEVAARADHSLVKSASSPRVVAGTDLGYELRVTNHGPSDSIGGEVVDDLAPGLSFAGSESGCTADGRRVRCPFGPLPVGRTATLRFTARVAPGVTGDVSNTAVAVPLDPDPGPRPNAGSVVTRVVARTDLAVALSAAPDRAVAGETLAYEVLVTNHGPSSSTGATVTDLLPPKLAFVSSADCTAEGRRVTCDLGPIPAGATAEPVRFEVLVDPSRRLAISNRARVAAAERDPDPDNNRSEPVETEVEVRADLVLCKAAPAEVFRGANALYRFTVTNLGPSDHPGDGEVSDPLVAELAFVSSEDGCAPEVGEVRCPVGRLPLGRERGLAFAARVAPATAAGTRLDNVATVSSPTDPAGAEDPSCPDDRDGDGSSTTTTSTVLDRPDLVLPYFEVDRDRDGAATLVALQSLDADPMEIRLDYFSADGLPLLFEESVVLCPRAIKTVHLRDVPGLFESGGTPLTGYVWITRTGPAEAPDCPELGTAGPAVEPLGAAAAGPALLAGDVLQLDSGSGTAHGSALLSPDPARTPAEVCGEWSVRFVDEEPFEGGTDFVFWLTQEPGPLSGEPEGVAPAVLTGVVYDAAGEVVATVSRDAPSSSFRRSFRELFGDDPPSPPSGTIEWTFPQGYVGNVSAVHRAEGRVSVSVPGVCRDRPARGRPPGADEALVLPYFELDPVQGGATTLLAVRNEGDGEVGVAFEYFDAAGDGPVFEETCTLPSRGSRTVDLGQLGPAEEEGCAAVGDPSALSTGFVEVRTVEPDPPPPEGEETPEVFLSGDYVRIGPAEGQAAGEALLDTDPSATPPALCRRWSTRVLHAGGLETDFVLYAPRQGGDSEEDATVTWTLRDERGACVAPENGECPGTPLILEAVASQVGSADLLGMLELEGDRFGSIEWTFPEGLRGQVSTRFRADLGSGGELSALVPGVCLDEPAPPDEPEPDP